MTEWWTYSLSDFLLFAPRTYRRLFELYNAEVWPGHLLALAVGLALLWCVTAGQGRRWAARAACALLAGTWLWVAWAFHLQRFATINWAAGWYASAFAVQGLLLLLVGAGCGAHLEIRQRRVWQRRIGIGLLLFALLVQPGLGVLIGRPWTQAEWFGMAPDPTALGTLGVLLLLQAGDRPTAARARCTLPVLMLWPIPMLWCAVSGATLWAMQAPEALLLPAAAVVATIAARASRHGG
ncbi:MAG: DUF6064 family protein [Rhizobacter sp.]|nr:DUF6064 family protein [Rhizobacter sp.]